MSLKMKQYLNFHEKGFINVKRKLQGVCSAVFLCIHGIHGIYC